VTLLGASPDEELSPQEADRALRNKPLWARYLVLGAGPLFNLLLPIPLLRVLPRPHDGGAADDRDDARRLGGGDLGICSRAIASWPSRTTTSTRGTRCRSGCARRRNASFACRSSAMGVRFDRFVTPRKNVVKNLVGEQEARGLLGVYPWVYAPQIGIIDTESPAYMRRGCRPGTSSPRSTASRSRRSRAREGAGAQPRHALRLTYLRPRAARGEFGTLSVVRVVPRAPAAAARAGQSTGLLPANTFIRTIEPDSPAARAGLAAGDRVLAVDDHPVTRWETIASTARTQGRAAAGADGAVARAGSRAR
jgi:regulator of sigma E protease